MLYGTMKNRRAYYAVHLRQQRRLRRRQENMFGPVPARSQGEQSMLMLEKLDFIARGVVGIRGWLEGWAWVAGGADLLDRIRRDMHDQVKRRRQRY